MSFPFSYIAPGEYTYCGCGLILLPKGVLICASCQHKSKLDDFACGICNKQASMFFVHGFRCEEHAFQEKPSQMIESERLVFTYGVRRGVRIKEIEAKKIAESKRIHEALSKERDALALQRMNDGMKPLFWIMAR